MKEKKTAGGTQGIRMTNDGGGGPFDQKTNGDDAQESGQYKRDRVCGGGETEKKKDREERERTRKSTIPETAPT